MNEITVRQGRPEDLPAVQALCDGFMAEYRQWDKTLNPDWAHTPAGVESYTRRLGEADETTVCYVAERDDKLIGYLMGELMSASAYLNKKAELRNIYVASGEQSHGAGGKLIEAFYDWCRQRNVDQVLVGTDHQNKRAIEFYQAQGFGPHEVRLSHKL